MKKESMGMPTLVISLGSPHKGMSKQIEKDPSNKPIGDADGWTYKDELEFLQWYDKLATKFGYEDGPYEGDYDYKTAFIDGAKPDDEGYLSDDYLLDEPKEDED